MCYPILQISIIIVLHWLYIIVDLERQDLKNLCQQLNYILVDNVNDETFCSFFPRHNLNNSTFSLRRQMGSKG